VAFIVTTTGTQSPVIFNDLGGRTLTHPTTSLDLEIEFSSIELSNSDDVQQSIDNGWITAKDESGTPILDATSQDLHMQFTELVTAGNFVNINHEQDPGGSSPKRIIQVTHDVVELGTNLALAWTPYDPEDYSAYEDRVNDGSLMTYWFNNLSMNPDGKWIGLDAGAPANVTHCRWFDYTTNMYQALHYKIDGSNDGLIWTNIIDVSTPPPHSPPPCGFTLDLGGTFNYRYYRYFCVDGKNANYIIIYEVEFYNVASPPTPNNSVAGTDYSLIYTSDSATRLCNTTGRDTEFTINIWIPKN
jgi:hypothetical protein